jgi:hypothetical protein
MESAFMLSLANSGYGRGNHLPCRLGRLFQPEKRIPPGQPEYRDPLLDRDPTRQEVIQEKVTFSRSAENAPSNQAKMLFFDFS